MGAEPGIYAFCPLPTTPRRVPHLLPPRPVPAQEGHTWRLPRLCRWTLGLSTGGPEELPKAQALTHNPTLGGVCPFGRIKPLAASQPLPSPGWSQGALPSCPPTALCAGVGGTHHIPLPVQACGSRVSTAVRKQPSPTTSASLWGLRALQVGVWMTAHRGSLGEAGARPAGPLSSFPPWSSSSPALLLAGSLNCLFRVQTFNELGFSTPDSKDQSSPTASLTIWKGGGFEEETDISATSSGLE